MKCNDCGQSLLAEADGADLFEKVYSLTDIEPDVASCIRNPLPLLERNGTDIGEDLGNATLGL